MSRSKRAAAITLGATMVVAGCGGDARLNEDLPACDPVEDAVPVGELGSEPWSSCDMEGLTVQFPDETEIEVPESGSTQARIVGNSVARWSVRNWGGYAVIASQRTEVSLYYWGTLEGIEHVRLKDPEAQHP